MNGHSISAIIVFVIGVLLIIWFVKNLLWIGIGIVIGAILGFNLSRLTPYWKEAVRRL